jgi:hypothetical protein
LQHFQWLTKVWTWPQQPRSYRYCHEGKPPTNSRMQRCAAECCSNVIRATQSLWPLPTQMVVALPLPRGHRFTISPTWMRIPAHKWTTTDLICLYVSMVGTHLLVEIHSSQRRNFCVTTDIKGAATGITWGNRWLEA